MTRRSMDEILAPEPIRERLPDAAPVAASAERPETEPEANAASETPAAKVEAKTEQPAKAAPKPPTDEHDEDEGDVPDNLDGLKRALAAARGDKRKARKQWQETDRQLAEIKGRMQAMAQMQAQAAPAKPAEQPKPEDEFYANPVEWQRKQLAQVRREMSVEMMRNSREDYDQVVGAFVQEIQGTPLAQQLEQQIANHSNPARFVYDYAKNFSKLKGINSLDDYEKRIEAQVRAKLEEEYAAKMSQTQPAATATPKPLPKPSLASARGNGAAAPQTWTGPRSFDDLFGQ